MLKQTNHVSVDKQLREWESLYKVLSGRELDFSNLKIPQHREGFDRLIVVAQDITIQQVFDECAKKFSATPCQTSYIFNETLDATWFNPRDRNASKGHYAIWARDSIYADLRWRNINVVSLWGINAHYENLLERLLHGYKYHLETGKHLDTLGGHSTTLCPSSISHAEDSTMNGCIAGVFWEDQTGLEIAWYRRDVRQEWIGPREVIV
jgi:hypothetical protein